MQQPTVTLLVTVAPQPGPGVFSVGCPNDWKSSAILEAAMNGRFHRAVTIITAPPNLPPPPIIRANIDQIQFG